MLNDERLAFLVELGFDESEVNELSTRYEDSLSDTIYDGCFGDLCYENLEFIKNKGYEQQLILYLLFLHSDSFMVSTDTFKMRLELIENELGYACERKIKADLFESGESRVFDLISWLTNDKEEWIAEMRKEVTRMKSHMY